MSDDSRPTLLIIGEEEPGAEGIRQALDRRGIIAHACTSRDGVQRAHELAPDLALLVGDAVADGGSQVVRKLAGAANTSVVPVALLIDDESLNQRLEVFRTGAVAVIPRTLSPDAVAERVAELLQELPERPGEAAGHLGSATLDQLLELVSREMRTGILSVEREDQPPIRLVLAAGVPVARTLDAFVKRLRPLIAKGETLRYEFHEASGGRLRLLEESEPTESASLDHLKGLRILLMDPDPARADALAKGLRGHEALVAVTAPRASELDRARALDPDVILLDANVLESENFEAIRTLWRDPRLRWANLIIAHWSELLASKNRADSGRVGARIASVLIHERELAARLDQDGDFYTRLEVTGPGRLIRLVAAGNGTRHVTARSARGNVELDIADGLLVGALAQAGSKRLEGSPALSLLLLLGKARVQIERREHPTAANLMLPIDQALSMATIDLPQQVMTAAPRPFVRSESGPPTQRAPFPAAAELIAGLSEKGIEVDEPVEDLPSEPTIAGPSAPKVKVESTRTGPDGPPQASDLKWGVPSPTDLVSKAERKARRRKSSSKIPAVSAPVKPPSRVKAAMAKTMMGMGGAAAPAAAKSKHAKTMMGVAPAGITPSKSATAAAKAKKIEPNPPTIDASKTDDSKAGKSKMAQTMMGVGPSSGGAVAPQSPAVKPPPLKPAPAAASPEKAGKSRGAMAKTMMGLGAGVAAPTADASAKSQSTKSQSKRPNLDPVFRISQLPELEVEPRESEPVPSIIVDEAIGEATPDEEKETLPPPPGYDEVADAASHGEDEEEDDFGLDFGDPVEDATADPLGMGAEIEGDPAADAGPAIDAFAATMVGEGAQDPAAAEALQKAIEESVGAPSEPVAAPSPSNAPAGFPTPVVDAVLDTNPPAERRTSRGLIFGGLALVAALVAGAVLILPGLLGDSETQVATHETPTEAVPDEVETVQTSSSNGTPDPTPDQNEPSQNDPSQNDPSQNNPSQNSPSQNDPSQNDPTENETATSGEGTTDEDGTNDDPDEEPTPPDSTNPPTDGTSAEDTETPPSQPDTTDSPDDADLEAMSERERERRSDQLVREATRSIRSGDLSTAQSALEEALRLDERNPRAMAGMAELYLEREDAANAIQYAEKAARRRSRRAAYHVLLGDARMLAGERAAANRAYRRALEVDPDNREAQRRLR